MFLKKIAKERLAEVQSRVNRFEKSPVIYKVVIPAAGIGTRLLPCTKEMPKEMLPVFSASHGALCLKPVLHVIFETLVESGLRDFCIIVGRAKRAVEDYFTVDDSFLRWLVRNGKLEAASELSNFYGGIRRSSIAFVNQHESKGFGHAVLCAKSFVGRDSFLLHAGDDLIVSRRNHISRLKNAYRKTNADAAFFVERTAHPERYGVIRARRLKDGIYKVTGLVEKPKRPPSKLGVIAVYALSPVVFDYLEAVKPDKGGEVQLADAIGAMIGDRLNVIAIGLQQGERRVDIGSPETYRMALTSVIR